MYAFYFYAFRRTFDVDKNVGTKYKLKTGRIVVSVLVSYHIAVDRSNVFNPNIGFFGLKKGKRRSVKNKCVVRLEQ